MTVAECVMACLATLKENTLQWGRVPSNAESYLSLDYFEVAMLFGNMGSRAREF
jgi:hypothetical protein